MHIRNTEGKRSMTAIFDLHNTVADLRGGQATVIEQHFGIALDRGAFAGGKAARQGNRLRLMLADGDIKMIPIDGYHHCMDQLMHERYLELVLPVPGAKEALAAAHRQYGGVTLVSKACAPLGRTTGMCKGLMEDFVLTHGLDVDYVFHDEDPEGRAKLGWFASPEVTLVVDNEEPVLRRVYETASEWRRLVHRRPAKGETGWRAFPAVRAKGIESCAGWPEDLTMPLAA